MYDFFVNSLQGGYTTFIEIATTCSITVTNKTIQPTCLLYKELLQNSNFVLF